MSEVAPLSQDVVQTDDSARHVQRVAQEKQLASALEPAQIVTLQNQARAAVYEAHRASGKSGLPDDATLQNAGNKAVAEARQAKVAGNPVVVVRPSAPPAPVPYQEQQRPSAGADDTRPAGTRARRHRYGRSAYCTFSQISGRMAGREPHAIRNGTASNLRGHASENAAGA